MKKDLPVIALPAERSCCTDQTLQACAGEVVVEYLYLDLQSCTRCIGTDQQLDEVMEVLIPALELAGYSVQYQKIEMLSARIARSYRFLSSPTIRINGRDLCLSVQENACGCCSEISGTPVECRVFEYQGRSFEIPPKQMLAEGILRAVFASTREKWTETDYVMPQNLIDFFAGKQNLHHDAHE